MTRTLKMTTDNGFQDPDPGRPRLDQVGAEMVEDQNDEEDDNPDDLDVDEAGFDNDASDFDVETDRRDGDDEGYVEEFD